MCVCSMCALRPLYMWQEDNLINNKTPESSWPDRQRMSYSIVRTRRHHSMWMGGRHVESQTDLSTHHR